MRTSIFQNTRSLGGRSWRIRAIALTAMAGAMIVLLCGWTEHSNEAMQQPLTDAQLAGQRVIYSYKGLTPPASLITAIKHGEAAGVIFFSDNISSKSQLKSVADELQADADTSPVKLPLLLMTDQEGGEVRRLPGAPTLSEKQVGEASDPARQAYWAGRNGGYNLRSAGLNVDLAPVLGVYHRAGDFLDQYQRSYSHYAKVVAKLGADFIRAQQATGVATTAKHFPGLGMAGADEDTDNRPVTLHVSLANIRSVQELPYRSAIPAGVKLIMVSWARYLALDRTRPAGLSRTIVFHELRQRLGFNGVTITDALEAGALRQFGGIGNRAVLAARAGMDLLLCSAQKVSEGTRAVDALARVLADGRMSRSGFQISVDRVQALRSSLAGS